MKSKERQILQDQKKERFPFYLRPFLQLSSRVFSYKSFLTAPTICRIPQTYSSFYTLRILQDNGSPRMYPIRRDIIAFWGRDLRFVVAMEVHLLLCVLMNICKVIRFPMTIAESQEFDPSRNIKNKRTFATIFQCLYV